MKQKSFKLFQRLSRREKGVALIIVISMVAILTLLVIAMVSLSSSESKSSRKFADGEFSRNLADSAVNLVMAQIWEGTKQDTGTTGREISASQPGAIRKYKNDGSFLRGYKLYSDDEMIVSSNEKQGMIDKDANDLAATGANDWRSQPARFVDLNEPVIRPDSAADQDSDPEVIFPIVDPRAFIRADKLSTGGSRTDSPNVEGFSYETTCPGVVDAKKVNDVDARLPMPVQWLYLLKDGTVCHTLAATGGATKVTLQSSNGVIPSQSNPIVGRIAFWTDDECSKLNINTASEPTYWAPPMAFHDRDYEWAVYQPMRFEYQRYPGHPATIALSTVLFPNRDLDLYMKSSSQREQIRNMKERIYEIMPKINRGGSRSGTVPFWSVTDPQYSGTRETRVDITNSLRERLYATVDELLFSEQIAGGTRRLIHDEVPGASVPLFNQYAASGLTADRALERVRFFLTANSRSPETTLFGTPRVAIWPVANEQNSGGRMQGSPAEYRTVFDNLIAFCSTLGSVRGPDSNSYFFRRADSTDNSFDATGISRNQKLLEYLYMLLGQNFPSGGRGSASFVTKYGPDAAQILAEIFDYIRSTNLQDGVLSAPRNELLTAYSVQGKDTRNILLFRDQMASRQRTFTASRASSLYDANGTPLPEQTTNNALPGHGQVTPIVTTLAGQPVMGFGRFLTVTEVGFQFICTADGTPDSGSFPDLDDPTKKSGGRTAARIDGTIQPWPGGAATIERGPPYTGGAPVPKYWYSNYPPYPSHGRYGTNPAATPDDPRHPSRHPAYHPHNWNATLDRDQALQPGQKRIQAMLNLELTAVGVGFTGLYPDLCIEISGMNNFKLGTGRGATPLFNALGSSTRVWRAQHNLLSATHCRPFGGAVGPTSLSGGRGVQGALEMPDDPAPYNPSVQAGGTSYDGHGNYDFISTYATVTGNTMTFQGGPLTLRVYSSRNLNTRTLVQEFLIQFPASTTLPVPELVVLGNAHAQWQDSLGRISNRFRTEAPRWWTFHSGGALRRYYASAPNDWANDGGIFLPNVQATRMTPLGGSEEELRTRGRLLIRNSSGGGPAATPVADTVIWGGSAGAPNYRLPGQTGVTRAPGGNNDYVTPGAVGPFGQDVVISMVPRHGDFRLIAAKQSVPASDWVPHPDVGKLPTPSNPVQGYMAHSFQRAAVEEPGASPGTGAQPNNRLVPNAPTNGGRLEDLPDTTLSVGGSAGPNSTSARNFGDFDTGLGIMRDGPWINRADEGNTGVDNMEDLNQASQMVRRPTAYFDEQWRSAEAGESYMSPNRMVSSPGMFGSLPTGVKANVPWRTLLFRPYVPPLNGQSSHPGSPNYGGAAPFNGINPADHYILDLFWMPVVEPYAVSEPFSTAGKVNINYQMVPFSNYIRRATAVHAAIKGEMLEAFPTQYVGRIKGNPPNARNVPFPSEFGTYHQVAKWTDNPSRLSSSFYSEPNSPRQFWHRNIDLESTAGGRGGNTATTTLAQFDARFNFNTNTPTATHGLFRTASQICEVHLVPKKVSGAQTTSITSGGEGADANPSTPYDWRSMNSFWDFRGITGENLRERPYANLYGKITTQSNTFRVHFRAQVIRKARSSLPTEFDPAKDAVLSDYRGSSVIERRIDPLDSRIPDYASRGAAALNTPLDNFYNFRVLETKRFAP